MESIKQFAKYMKADERPSVDGSIDISSLLGEWFNTKADTIYLKKVILSERNGSLIINCYGVSDEGLIDWGEAEAIPYGSGTSSAIAAGFHALFNLDEIETHLVSNQKLNILVIQSYTRYLDGSGRIGHFSREFFHR
ncbi:hypothetical protein [Calothrix sp. CCY 0018]|uniref:hypothetical protein n=1 Tax=Calothrix sp. CCY 0018 TaxID=3103864 RepID=UPI0039C6586F